MNRFLFSRTPWAPVLSALLSALPAPSSAQAPPTSEGAVEAAGPGHYGPLRVRDLTFLDLLRLDMRAPHAVSGPPGSWNVALDFGYQNTWTLSGNVEKYLESLPGRRRLGPAEVQAIRDLPGEAYLVDLELGVLDVTFHRRLTGHWGVYGVLSAVTYNGGFLDGGIEWFHDAFNMDPAGRPAVRRNDINVILDLKSAQLYQPALPDGGLLDPTLGVRYDYAPAPAPWNLVIEGALKVPIDGERPFLSTGRADFGLQVTLQRFLRRHAGYASLAAVYARASKVAPTYGTQVVPTLILGYEYKWTDQTNLNAQIYASPSVLKRSDTDLDELRDPKFQISLGMRYRAGDSVLSFALTENLVNYNNSPDFGLQLGWAYSPTSRR